MEFPISITIYPMGDRNTSLFRSRRRMQIDPIVPMYQTVTVAVAAAITAVAICVAAVLVPRDQEGRRDFRGFLAHRVHRAVRDREVRRERQVRRGSEVRQVLRVRRGPEVFRELQVRRGLPV